MADRNPNISPEYDPKNESPVESLEDALESDFDETQMSSIIAREEIQVRQRILAFVLLKRWKCL